MPAASCTLNAPQPKVPPVSSVTRAAMPAWRSTSSSDARCSAPRRSAGDVADQPGNARSAASTAARALARAAAAAALPPSARLLAPVPGSSSAPIRCSVIGGPPVGIAARDLYASRGMTGPVSSTPRATTTQSGHPAGSTRHFRRVPQGLVRLSLFVDAALSEGARLTPASREDGQPQATLGRQAEARPGGSSLLKMDDEDESISLGSWLLHSQANPQQCLGWRQRSGKRLGKSSRRVRGASPHLALNAERAQLPGEQPRTSPPICAGASLAGCWWLASQNVRMFGVLVFG